MSADLPLLRLAPLITIDLGTPVRCELPLEGRCIELPNARWVLFLSRLAGELDIDSVLDRAIESLGVDADTAVSAVEHALISGLLVPATVEPPELHGIRHWIARGWLEALLFHLRTRSIRFADDQQVDTAASQNSVLSSLTAAVEPTFWKPLPADAETVDLPPPRPLDTLPPLEKVLLRRRSNQPWRGGSLSSVDLHTILQAASLETVRLRTCVEATWREQPSRLLDSAFSATELYVAAFDVDGIEQGLYHWDPRGTLRRLRRGCFREDLRSTCVGQTRAGDGACAFIISVDWVRYMYRYRHPRALRTLFINAAELAQKVILLATALERSTFLTPAFEDELGWQLIGSESREESLMEVVTIG